MSSKIKGDITESFITYAILNKKYKVSIPFGENCRYDLIMDDGKKLHKLQCKTGRIKEGSIVFNTTNNVYGEDRNYIGQIDAFMVFSHELKKVYYIPIKKAPKREMSLRVNKPKIKHPNIKYAKDYEF